MFVLAVFATRHAPAADDSSALDPAATSPLTTRAIEFLATAQTPEGAFSPQAGPAVTALVTAGILKSGRTADDPLVARSLKYLQTFVHPDGGIYKPDSTHKNYETCIAMVAFAAANADGRFDKLLAAADRYVKGLQWDEDESIERSHENYGGAGYGSKKRPDLSNTSFLLDALRAAGNSPDDPAIQKALIFVSRCQNLESEHNTTKFAAKNPDGGFYYTIAAGGASMAGETPEGGLRSYGSMTYSGLKSMIFAGLGPDDPRVKAAFEWCSKHYDLKSNPGMGEAGLYYYYHTFAKALDALGAAKIKDADGAEHDWRAELVTELARRQQPNGSWVNGSDRWMEGDANLVTGYVLLTLSYCRGK
ncbi:MAG: terpene cyclase/mutase family protein [Pirellulales bacterium]|nr:terpene cyclase/mutase family protein [Pirellulales bacterium]